MYSFKHALTQDVVYASLLERRRRRYHAAAARGLEELHAEPARRGGRAPRLPLRQRAARTRRPSTTPFSPPRRRSAAGPTPRRSPSSRPPSSASRRCRTPTANRLRRIDAVVKQAEIKFALAVTPSTSRPWRRSGPRGDGGRPAPPRGLVLLGGIPPQPDRGPPRGVRSPIAGRRWRSRTPTASTTSAPSPRAASPTSSGGWDLREALERVSAPSPSSRRAATCGGRAGRSGLSAWPRTASASGREASTTAAGPSSTARP